MSEENVEIIRRANAAFNEGGTEAAAQFFTEDAEFHEPPEQPAPRMARGIEEVTKMFGEFDDAWAEHKSELKEVRAVGADRVLAFSVERFVGRDGIELAAPAGAVFTFREGKIARWQAFWERASAVEAAGLSE